MTSDSILYLSREDVESVGLDMRSIIDLLEQAFKEKGQGKVEMPPKPGIHTMPDAFIHAMPAYIPSMKSAGIKWVSGYPGELQTRPAIHQRPAHPQRRRDRLSVCRDGLHLDHRLSHRRGLRACSQVPGARRKARPSASWHAACRDAPTSRRLSCLFQLKKVYAFDVLPQVQENFVREMSKQLGVEVIGVKDPRQAVKDSDMVVTSGPILKHPTPTIDKDWLKPGGFASAVDFDSYFTGAAMQQMDRISTDDHGQFQYYKSVGYFEQTPDPYADLGELVAGLKPGRQSADRAHDGDQPRPGSRRYGRRADDLPLGPRKGARRAAPDVRRPSDPPLKGRGKKKSKRDRWGSTPDLSLSGNWHMRRVSSEVTATHAPVRRNRMGGGHLVLRQ